MSGQLVPCPGGETVSRFSILGICAVGLICGVLPTRAQTSPPPFITKALADYGRLPTDVWQDPAIKPAEALTFLRVGPGQKVVDFLPGSLYWTRLFYKIAGEKGKVYPFVPQIGCRPTRNAECDQGAPYSTSMGYKNRPKETLMGDPRQNGINQALELEATTPFRNLYTLWNVAGQFSVPEQLDLVWIAGHYHDLHTKRYQVDMGDFNARIFESMNPGGILVVADYAAAPGAGFKQVETLHRVEKEAVKAEVMKAGFLLDGESTLWAKPTDDHSKPVADDTAPGAADMFLLRFKKPMNAPPPRRPTRAQLAGWIDSNFTGPGDPQEYKGGGIFYNGDGTYQEYRGATNYQGTWFLDAGGQICLRHEFPGYVRGLLGCHPWVEKKPGDVWQEDVNRDKPATVTLRKEHTYPPKPAPNDRPGELPPPNAGRIF